jgi:hypothetical protein
MILSILLLVLFIQLSTEFCTLIKVVDAETSIEIVSHSGYLTQEGFFKVVGEVQNTGNQSVKNVMLQVVFYDIYNQSIRIEEDPILIRELLPGRKSPISIYLSNKTQAAQVKSYEISIASYEECPELPAGLEIVWSQWNGSIALLYGKLRNYGSNDAKFAEVFATFYDEHYKVVEVGVSQMILLFGAKSDENIEIDAPPDVYKRATWYSLTAQSLEYSVKEETGLTQLNSPDENYIFYLFGILVAISAIALLVVFLIARTKHRRTLRRKRVSTIQKKSALTSVRASIFQLLHQNSDQCQQHKNWKY